MRYYNTKNESVDLEQQHKNTDYPTELKRRIQAALILIPLVLGLIYLGPPLSVLFGILVIIGLFVEWIRLTVAPFDQKPHFTLGLLIFGFVYIGISGFWIINLLADGAAWPTAYMLLLTIWSADAAAYFVGKKMGGAKLAPTISPNKTWSGFIAGIFLGTLIGGAAYILFSVESFAIWLIPLLVLIAQLGDLLESKIKRLTGVKDSSTLIPGHGGILDRLDSLLAVSFFMAFWQGF